MSDSPWVIPVAKPLRLCGLSMPKSICVHEIRRFIIVGHLHTVSRCDTGSTCGRGPVVELAYAIAQGDPKKQSSPKIE